MIKLAEKEPIKIPHTAAKFLSATFGGAALWGISKFIAPNLFVETQVLVAALGAAGSYVATRAFRKSLNRPGTIGLGDAFRAISLPTVGATLLNAAVIYNSNQRVKAKDDAQFNPISTDAEVCARMQWQPGKTYAVNTHKGETVYIDCPGLGK